MLENVILILEDEYPMFRTNPENLHVQLDLPLRGFDLNGIRNRTAIRVNSNEIESIVERSTQQLISQCTENNILHPTREEELWLSHFSNEEKKVIRRIQQIDNFDLGEVVQVYIACDKDEQMTIRILSSE